MAPQPRWPSEALEALRAIGPYDRAGLARFRQRFPEITPDAIRSKLSTLRIRGQALDVDYRRRRSPFPVYGFG